MDLFGPIGILGIGSGGAALPSGGHRITKAEALEIAKAVEAERERARKEEEDRRNRRIREARVKELEGNMGKGRIARELRRRHDLRADLELRFSEAPEMTERRLELPGEQEVG